MTHPYGVPQPPNPYHQPVAPPYRSTAADRTRYIPREPSPPPGGIMGPAITPLVRTPTLTVWMMVKDVAVLLDVSPMTIYRLIHHGELIATRVGRSFRIKESDVSQFIEENSTRTG